MNPTALGRLCVERGLITEDQLQHCLDVQRSSPEWHRLGEILLKQGMITGVALANLLNIQGSMRRKSLPPPPVTIVPKASGAPASPVAASTEPAAPPTELAWFLKEARANGASGLVLGAGQPPAFRTADDTHLLEGPPLKASQINRMMSEALPQSLLAELEAEGSAAGPVDIAGAEQVRITLYRHRGGVAIALRTMANHPVQLDQLGLPEGVRTLIRPGGGLVLVTGPSGSGTSTTLAALLTEIAATTPAHITVIERVRELMIPPGRAWISRREIGWETQSYAGAVRSTLGADVDVVAAAELSYPDAIAAAIDVAMAGKLVIGTMHTPGAAATIQRVLDTFADRRVPYGGDALASCLRGIVSQRLFPARDQSSSLVAAELLLASVPTSFLIRDGTTDRVQTVFRSGREIGMVSLEDSLAGLVQAGRISAAEALENANDGDSLRRMLGYQQGETIRVGH